ncbi:MAG: DUF3500 domain-containing protein [Phycisphaeraceae bacterium]
MRYLGAITPFFFVCLLGFGCQAERDLVLVSADRVEPAELPEPMVGSTRGAATDLLASLDAERRERVLRPIASPLRKDWHFVPRARQGLMLGDMTAEQKRRVHRLMQTALSDAGYLKATDIIWLEAVLYEMSGENPLRDPGKYALLIFGDPSDESAAWGWRLEGHHLSINLTYTAEGLGVTPLFFGTNPAVVQQGPLAGKRVLADAHHLAIALASSMDADQRERMRIADKPRDVFTGPGRERSLSADAPRLGIDLHLLDQSKIDLAQQLVRAHLFDNLELQHRMIRARTIGTASAPDDHQLMFAWAGPIDADEAFYYRIQSADLVIEYSCQNKNHVHAVVHDLTDPLQEDLLKKHFEAHEH